MPLGRKHLRRTRRNGLLASSELFASEEAGGEQTAAEEHHRTRLRSAGCGSIVDLEDFRTRRRRRATDRGSRNCRHGSAKCVPKGSRNSTSRLELRADRGFNAGRSAGLRVRRTSAGDRAGRGIRRSAAYRGPRGGFLIRRENDGDGVRGVVVAELPVGCRPEFRAVNRPGLVQRRAAQQITASGAHERAGERCA